MEIEKEMKETVVDTEMDKAKKKEMDESEESTEKMSCDCGKEDCKMCSEKKEAGKSEEGNSPTESAQTFDQAPNTISPNSSTPSQAQHMMFGNSERTGDARMASGNTPSGTSYAGKSASTPDLMKSPLFVELSKQLESINKSVSQKLDAIEKSVNDRILNVQEMVKKVEKFYEMPLYKAAGSTEVAQAEKTVSQMMKEGELRYSS